MQDIYTDPILKKYIDLIQSYTNSFKRVYFGDPIKIGASELPALIIAKVDTTVGNMTTSEDRHNIRITLTAVTDIRDTITDDAQMVAGVNNLYNLMEGRNANYSLKTDSLLYILRHNVELDPANNLRTDLNTITRIDYGMTLGKRRGADSWSVEGMLEFIATFSQVR